MANPARCKAKQDRRPSPARSRWAAEMDGCPRQNPAYRLAKEEAPQGASSICQGLWRVLVAIRPLTATVPWFAKDRGLAGLGPLVLDPSEAALAPPGQELIRGRIARAIGVVQKQIPPPPHPLH